MTKSPTENRWRGLAGDGDIDACACHPEALSTRPVSCKASRRTARHGEAAIASIGRTPACASTASRAHIGLDEN